jgi:ribosomal protein S18 acetylase RimI-like enzyme
VAKQSSPGHLWLHVFQQNIAAITFYGAHGFGVVESSDGSRNMELLPDLTMRWTASETRGPSASS